MSIVANIELVLSKMKGISLEEVLKASLMRRKDSKYVFDLRLVPALLEKISDQYRVLDIDGIRAQDYQTLYFDTPGLDMYHMHHRGLVNRQKIRFRKYGSSDNMFLEVKQKNGKGITIKNRMESMNGKVSIRSTEEEFLDEFTPYRCNNIAPVLENRFNRVTLVNESQSERITLDYSLWFSCSNSKENIKIPGVAIAEIKFADHLAGSVFHAALRSERIIPNRISKYCIGMAMLNPGLKQNLFKQKVRYVKKINHHHLQSLKN